MPPGMWVGSTSGESEVKIDSGVVVTAEKYRIAATCMYMNAEQRLAHQKLACPKPTGGRPPVGLGQANQKPSVGDFF